MAAAIRSPSAETPALVLKGCPAADLPEPALAPAGPDCNRQAAWERGGILKRAFDRRLLFVAAASAIDDDIVANVADGARIERRHFFLIKLLLFAAQSACPDDCASKDRRSDDIGDSIS